MQDQNNYVSDAKSAGLSVSTGFSGGVPSISGNANKSHMESTYASVTTQAGIYGGTGGVNVNVGDTTTLNGAVISSNASADKNAVTTNHLVMNDIQNKAEYSTSGMGLNYKYTPNFDKADDATRNKEYKEQGLTPNIPISASGKSASTTKSAVTEGSLKVLDGKIDSATVERNTQNTVHTLATIFDKKKLEERQALAYEFSKNANEAIHRISEANGWKDGDPRKVALHAAVGAVSAELGGGNATIGGVSGAVNEVAVKKIIQTVGAKHPDLAQLASAVLGYATDKVLGGNGQTGAYAAYMATKWNSLLKIYKKVYLGYSHNASLGHVFLLFEDDKGYGKIVEYDAASYPAGLLWSNYLEGKVPAVGIIREITVGKEEISKMKQSFIYDSESDAAYAQDKREIRILNNFSVEEINNMIDKINYIEDEAKLIYLQNGEMGPEKIFYETSWKDYYLKSRNCTIFVNYVGIANHYGFNYKSVYIPRDLWSFKVKD